MRGRYVVLVVLIGAVWWMHRRTTDAEAVAPTPSAATKTTTAPRGFTAPTPRPELPPERPLPTAGLSWARSTTVDRPLPAASPNTIHGRVTTVAGEPIHGVLVSLESPTGWRVGASNDDGYYAIDHVPAGRYAVRYSIDGYELTLEAPVSDDMPTESFAVLDLADPIVNGDDVDRRAIDGPIQIEEPMIDEVNEHPIKYNDPAIDWD